MLQNNFLAFIKRRLGKIEIQKEDENKYEKVLKE